MLSQTEFCRKSFVSQETPLAAGFQKKRNQNQHVILNKEASSIPAL